jgi:hypothetical protein
MIPDSKSIAGSIDYAFSGATASYGIAQINYSEITGISKEEFISTLEEKRHKALGNQEVSIQDNADGQGRPTLFIEDLRSWVLNNEE